MVPRRDLIVFGEDWGRHPSSTQHIMQHLPMEWNILWVNSIGLRRPRLNMKDVRRLGQKLTDFTRASTTPGVAAPEHGVQALAMATTRHNMSVLSPLAVSWPASRLAFRINRQLLARQVSHQLIQQKMSKPVLWVSVPTALPVVGALDERALVYYCGDDFGSLQGVDSEPVMRMEREIAKKADLIFAANEGLLARFDATKSTYLPHGVDADLFSRPMARAVDLPTGRPIIGTYGLFSEWIDRELLHQAASELKDWLFVFVGNVVIDPGPLKELPNVLFLGPRNHRDLPGYVQHWDVSLMPFRKCDQIFYSNPLKLREYLAAGTPIATVDFPALAPYRDVLAVSHTRTDFTLAIRQAFGDAPRNAMRRERMTTETWAHRAEVVSAALEQL
jgi:hypothetical protein